MSFSTRHCRVCLCALKLLIDYVDVDEKCIAVLETLRPNLPFVMNTRLCIACSEKVEHVWSLMQNLNVTEHKWQKNLSQYIEQNLQAVIGGIFKPDSKEVRKYYKRKCKHVAKRRKQRKVISVPKKPVAGTSHEKKESVNLPPLLQAESPIFIVEEIEDCKPELSHYDFDQSIIDVHQLALNADLIDPLPEYKENVKTIEFQMMKRMKSQFLTTFPYKTIREIKLNADTQFNQYKGNESPIVILHRLTEQEISQYERKIAEVSTKKKSAHKTRNRQRNKVKRPLSFKNIIGRKKKLWLQKKGFVQLVRKKNGRKKGKPAKVAQKRMKVKAHCELAEDEQKKVAQDASALVKPDVEIIGEDKLVNTNSTKKSKLPKSLHEILVELRTKQSSALKPKEKTDKLVVHTIAQGYWKKPDVNVGSFQSKETVCGLLNSPSKMGGDSHLIEEQTKGENGENSITTSDQKIEIQTSALVQNAYEDEVARELDELSMENLSDICQEYSVLPSQPAQNLITCQICTETFEIYRDLLVHCRLIHKKALRCHCPDCYCCFKSAGLLNHHRKNFFMKCHLFCKCMLHLSVNERKTFRIEEDIEQERCKLNEKKSSQLKFLRVLETIDEKGKKYFVNTLPSESALKSNIAHVEDNKNSEKQEENVPPLSVSQSLLCRLCDKVVDEDIVRHKCGPPALYTCKVCGTNCESLAQLDNCLCHKTSKSDACTWARCNRCSIFFKGNLKLWKHVRQAQMLMRYQCPRCPSYCAEKSKLLAHLRFHQQQTLFRCTRCDKSFHHENVFKTHCLQEHDI